MTASVGDVVTQLLAAVAGLDRAATTAARAHVEATTAARSLGLVAVGTAHRDMRSALHESTIGSQKLAKLARLAAKAAESLTTYVAIIAPGGEFNSPSPAALPSGESLVAEPASSGALLGAFIRKAIASAGDVEDAVKHVEDLTTDGVRALVGSLRRPHREGVIAPSNVPHLTAAERPPLEHPVTAVVFVAGFALIGVKELVASLQRRREGREHDRQPGAGELPADDDPRGL